MYNASVVHTYLAVCMFIGQKLSRFYIPLVGKQSPDSGQMWHFATMPGVGHCNITLHYRLHRHPVSL
jgi:hypothetical protein